MIKPVPPQMGWGKEDFVKIRAMIRRGHTDKAISNYTGMEEARVARVRTGIATTKSARVPRAALKTNKLIEAEALPIVTAAEQRAYRQLEAVNQRFVELLRRASRM